MSIVFKFSIVITNNYLVNENRNNVIPEDILW